MLIIFYIFAGKCWQVDDYTRYGLRHCK